MSLLITITHHSFCLLMTDHLLHHPLTDFVIMGSVGISEKLSQLTNQLQRNVKPSYDLKRCGEVLEKMMDPLSGKEGEFEMVLTGFYSHGRTGEISLRSGIGKVNELVYPLRGSNEYLFTFIPPDPSLFQTSELLLELPDDNPTTLQNYADHLTAAVYPTLLSMYPNQVHPVGKLFALEKGLLPNQKPLFHKMVFDASERLPFLPAREELEMMLFGRP